MSETNVKVLTETPEEPQTTSPLKEKAVYYAKVTAVTVVASVAVYYASKKFATWVGTKLSDDDETPSESTTS